MTVFTNTKTSSQFSWLNDLFFWLIISTVTILLIKGWYDMHAVITATDLSTEHIKLDPQLLPYYTLRTWIIFFFAFHFYFWFCCSKI